MEVGTEISQKIRSAIKAKLIELGAYVDDELPDYIMVMVANKKSREQMISDLNLFLGKNTDTFAEWLHGLLGKLQTISVDSNADKDAKEKKKSDSKKEKKVKKSSKGESFQGKKVRSKKSADTKTDKTGDSKSIGEKTKQDKDNSQHDSNKEKGTSQTDSTEIEDVRQMLVTVAPTDELAAELETTEARIQQSHQEASQAGKTHCSESDRDTGSDIRNATVRRKRSASPASERRSVQSSSAPKKHRGLISVVANVSKDEEEEEYDPLCPAVGSVASVVKVTSRKSKIPPALQANSDGLDQSILATNVTENEETIIEDRIRDSHQTGSVMVQLDQTASLDSIRTVLMEVLTQSKEEISSDRDDISAFCQSIACCLRKMNQRNLAIAKLRIQKILFDYESSIQSGGNDRWTAASINNSNNTSVVNNSSLQISSTGGNRSSNCVSQKQQCTNTTMSSNNLASTDCNESTNLKSKIKPSPSINTSSCSITQDVESPLRISQSQSSITMPKSDNTLVTSSSKNDRLSPFRHRHNPHANVSEINLFSSQSDVHLQPSTSHGSPLLQPISLDSLHLKRRSELESSMSSSKSQNSILKFRPLLQNAQTSGSGATNQNSGADSPKPLSAEQLKVLAKNLKITITNSRGKSSDDESESSSDGSDEDTDSEEDDNDDEDEEKKKQAIKGSTDKEGGSIVKGDLNHSERERSVDKRELILNVREINTTATHAKDSDRDGSTRASPQPRK